MALVKLQCRCNISGTGDQEEDDDESGEYEMKRWPEFYTNLRMA